MTACGGGGGGSDDAVMPVGGSFPEPSEGMLGVNGIVIDGPVAGATVVILDANGDEVASVISYQNATFWAEIPEDTAYPLSITASGGINLTTEADPGFILAGIVTSSDQSDVVLSSLSTLVIRRAECAAETAGRARASSHKDLVDHQADNLAVLEAYGFGLDADQRNALMSGHPGSAADAAALLLASEVLAETLRRASTALSSAGHDSTPESLLWAVACDLGDGTLDGMNGDSNGDSNVVQETAAFHAAASAVLIESAQGKLRIDSRDVVVTDQLEAAISTTFGLPSEAAIAALPLNAYFLDQTLRSMHAAMTTAPSDEFFDLYAQLLSLANNAPRAEVGLLLAEIPSSARFASLLEATVGDAESASRLNGNAGRALDNIGPPDVTLTASPQSLNTRGTESTTITYTATNATVCHRTGSSLSDWSGVAATSAEERVGPISQIETFGLRCAGPGGITEQSVEVVVPPNVAVAFVSESGDDNGAIALGDRIRVEYNVDDASAENCEIRRSDTNEALASGTQITATAGLSISVSCEGSGGTYMTAERVPVRGARLTWDPPTQRENGEPLDDLAGYRIYHGTAPGGYDADFISVDDPAQSSFEQAFPPGLRYFAVTAVTSTGIESRLSNEVSKTIP